MQTVTATEAAALAQLSDERVRPFVAWLERSRAQLHGQLEHHSDERASAAAQVLSQILKEIEEAPQTCARFMKHTGAGGPPGDLR